MSNYWKFINMLNDKGLLNEDLPYQSIIQLVGDRDNPSISMKDCVFTIPANPMSDRGQLVLENLSKKEVVNIDNFIERHNDHIRVREATKQGYAIGVDGDSINFEQPNSKTRRGRVGHQIAQTLTCSCNQGVIIEVNEDKINIGFIENKYKEFYNKNGYIPKMFNPYNCAEITDYAPTQTTQCWGTTKSSAVLITNKLNNEGDNIMKEFTNNLIKYNFKMDTIRLFDSFAGIGSLHQGLKELGVPMEIIGLSETDVDAIISYSGIHIDKTNMLLGF